MDERPPRSRPHLGALSADVVHNGGDWSLFEPVTETIVSAVAALNAELGLSGEPPREAAIALSDDQEVRRLNAIYRGEDKPTNVLSFEADGSISSDQSQGIPTNLGDIVLAAETMLREASELEITPRDHLAHLVVHGLLHLLGHDHDEPDPARQMEALETAILARIGIADPYDAQTYSLATEEGRTGRPAERP